jgi:hypothetical protein
MSHAETIIATINRLGPIADDTGRLAELIGVPFQDWGDRCHEISLKLLRTGEFGPGRIARGTCKYVIGQHSWIVLGDDCYDENATIVDPTLWAHAPTVSGIFIGRNRQWHRPHGAGLCFEAGMPCTYGGPDIELTPSQPLSDDAQDFLWSIGQLDFRGWGEVAHLPVEGWPAAEIVAAMADTPALRALVPVDILGMLTDRNPGGLYR